MLEVLCCGCGARCALLCLFSSAVVTCRWAAGDAAIETTRDDRLSVFEHGLDGFIASDMVQLQLLRALACHSSIQSSISLTITTAVTACTTPCIICSSVMHCAHAHTAPAHPCSPLVTLRSTCHVFSWYHEHNAYGCIVMASEALHNVSV